MTARRTPQWPPPLRPYLVAVAMIAALALVVAYAFNPRLPFTSTYEVEAVMDSSAGLRKGSPVRIAGVNVGKVSGISRGPGHTTLVTLEVKEAGRPVRADATVRVRPRVFLEGGYLVELSPGSPSARELPDGGTIPLPQTAAPVQFHDLLKVFDRPSRESLQTILDTTARALDDGGAAGLRTLAPELRPLLRDTAWVAEALRGTEHDDVSRLVAATDRLTSALARDPRQLGSLVDNLATVTGAVHARDAELAATVRGLDGVMREAPAALDALDAALPSVESAATQVAPALEIAPAALAETAAVLGKLGRLVAPGRRDETIAGLETAFVALPGLVGRMAGVFPAAKPTTDCLSSHVLPVFESEVPDGELSTGRPAWQDFVHALVGLAGASSNFDGNGHSLRYQFGTGDQSFSTFAIPGFGQLLANAPSSLQSRPLPASDRALPPFRTDVPCSSQPPVDLEAASGPAGLQAARGVRRGPAPSLARVERLMRPRTLARILEGAR